VLNQAAARQIAKKLKAEIKPGRKHDLAVFRHGGIRPYKGNSSLDSSQKSMLFLHDLGPQRPGRLFASMISRSVDVFRWRGLLTP
jgi:hypothetical protein